MLGYLTIFSILCSVLNANQVPVLTFFGDTKSSPLTVGKIIGQNDFLGEVKDHLNKDLTVIVLNKLSTQELTFAVRKMDLKPSVDLKLQVESPFQSIQTYSKNHNINLKVVEVDNLEEALNTFNKIHQSSNVILTGKQAHLRSKRAADEKEPTNGNSTKYAFGDECAAYFDAVYYIDLSNLQTSTYIYLPIQNSTNEFKCSQSANSQELTIKFDKNSGIKDSSIDRLSFVFKKTNNTQYYVLDKSTVYLNNSETLSLVYMGAPYGMETPVNFSFVCTKTAFKVQNSSLDGRSNSKVWFYIQNLQLQPTGVLVNGSDYTFGKLNYCQGFFSSGIWMAITASLLLAFILAFGVSLLMNVKTMDRFDDPKGKPLNVGSEK